MSDPCAGSQVHDCPKRLFATGRGADSNHEVEEAHCDGDVRKEDSAGDGEIDGPYPMLSKLDYYISFADVRARNTKLHVVTTFSYTACLLQHP